MIKTRDMSYSKKYYNLIGSQLYRLEKGTWVYLKEIYT